MVKDVGRCRHLVSSVVAGLGFSISAVALSLSLTFAIVKPLFWSGAVFRPPPLCGAASWIGLKVVLVTDHFERSRKSGGADTLSLALSGLAGFLFWVSCVLLLVSFGLDVVNGYDFLG